MEFKNNEALSRYEAWVESELVGEAHYVRSNGVADFDRTLVPQRFEGRGVAGKLVGYAMDEIRAGGALKVKPTCPYVVHWFELHPEYADLLA
jgi:predicted GNAT family acetyltransferase